MSKIEGLGYDKHHNPSSKAVIKSGPNRGWRLPEKDGKWVYISSVSEYARSQEQAINFEWGNKLVSLGFRVGKLTSDGCTGFYILR